jgi:hypothetical protein
LAFASGLLGVLVAVQQNNGVVVDRFSREAASSSV